MIESMLNLLLRCRHRRMTRPITPVHRPSAPHPGTYVACLDCGKRFQYDVANMRIGAPLPISPAPQCHLPSLPNAIAPEH